MRWGAEDEIPERPTNTHWQSGGQTSKWITEDGAMSHLDKPTRSRLSAHSYKGYLQPNVDAQSSLCYQGRWVSTYY